MSKYELGSILQDAAVSQTTRAELFNILDTCEAGLFTSVAAEDDEAHLLTRTETVLNALTR